MTACQKDRQASEKLVIVREFKTNMDEWVDSGEGELKGIRYRVHKLHNI